MVESYINEGIRREEKKKKKFRTISIKQFAAKARSPSQVLTDFPQLPIVLQFEALTICSSATPKPMQKPSILLFASQIIAHES